MYEGRSRIERGGGLHTRENAGISSERRVRNLSVENLRFPGEGSSAQGKSGPKSRAKAVDDGQQVDIPVPRKIRLNEAMTQKDSRSELMDKFVQIMRLTCSEVHTS